MPGSSATHPLCAHPMSMATYFRRGCPMVRSIGLLAVLFSAGFVPCPALGQAAGADGYIVDAHEVSDIADMFHQPVDCGLPGVVMDELGRKGDTHCPACIGKLPYLVICHTAGMLAESKNSRV